MAIKTFTTGEVLTASDTNTYLANSGLVYVTSVAVGSGVLTVNVPNAFSATYDNYRIVLSNIDCSIDGNGIKLLLNGIATAVYSSAGVLSSYSAAAPTGTGYVNDSGGCLIGTSTTTNDIHSFVDICNPFLAQRKTLTYQNSSANVCSSGGGYVNSTTSATGFTIDVDGAATFTGGVITCYGYRKA